MENDKSKKKGWILKGILGAVLLVLFLGHDTIIKNMQSEEKLAWIEQATEGTSENVSILLDEEDLKVIFSVDGLRKNAILKDGKVYIIEYEGTQTYGRGAAWNEASWFYDTNSEYLK